MTPSAMRRPNSQEHEKKGKLMEATCSVEHKSEDQSGTKKSKKVVKLCCRTPQNRPYCKINYKQISIGSPTETAKPQLPCLWICENLSQLCQVTRPKEVTSEHRDTIFQPDLVDLILKLCQDTTSIIIL